MGSKLPYFANGELVRDNNVKTVKLSEHISKNYHEIAKDALKNNHNHYWLYGGRGSLKSSFVFIYVSYMMTALTKQGYSIHCVAFRKIKETIKDSIYSNFEWAFSLLGVDKLWNGTTVPMKFQYKNSTILFRGCKDKKDMEKIKSIKFKKGNIMFAIFEELTEFDGWNEILVILQSIFRGTNKAQAFYMYNPPPNKSSWVNVEARKEKANTYYHFSNYLDVPKEWLGNIFIEEAKNLKETNERLYNHMYLGEQIGEGLEIYPNVTVRSISSDEILSFDVVYRGIDFGFAADASHYVECFYSERTMTLYIFNEIYGHGMTNQTIYEYIKPLAGNMLVYGDCAEPRTINELKLLGLNIRGAKKGKDSKAHGIKWLSSLNQIVIDKKRCPYTANDFLTYELKKDLQGNIIQDYPKEPHSSAAVRYALNVVIRQNKFVFI